MKNARPVYLSLTTWLDTIEAIRYTAHSEPDEAHLGLDPEKQRALHTIADVIVAQLGIEHDCAECEMIAGHTEPEEACEGCKS